MSIEALPSFTYSAPTTVWFAPDGTARLGSYLKRLEITRALMVCDPRVATDGVSTRIAETSKGRVHEIWAHVEPDAPRAAVIAGAEAAARLGADGIVAVGGGSAIDTAKAIALLAKHGGELDRWDGPGKVGAPGLPLVAIPTTAGTGSEASCIAVIKDEARRRKLVILDRALYPAVAILDPRLTVGLPPRLTAATGMDALTHAVEGIVARYHQPICDAVGLECVRLVRAHLPRAVTEPMNLDARGWMLVAASMAGQLVSMTYSGVAHAVAHALGIGWGVHHGTGNAVALPWSIRWNASDPASAARYARCAQAFGTAPAASDEATARRFADDLERFVEGLGLPTRLGALGVAAGDLPRLAEIAFADPSHGPNPVAVANAGELEKALGSLL